MDSFHSTPYTIQYTLFYIGPIEFFMIGNENVKKCGYKFNYIGISLMSLSFRSKRRNFSWKFFDDKMIWLSEYKEDVQGFSGATNLHKMVYDFGVKFNKK